jgi:hypothetical protein
MGNADRSGLSRTKSSFGSLFYWLAPVLSGVVAAVAGGIAWHRPAIGLCMLLCVMIGYTAGSAMLIHGFRPARRLASEPRHLALRLVVDRSERDDDDLDGGRAPYRRI